MVLPRVDCDLRAGRPHARRDRPGGQTVSVVRWAEQGKAVAKVQGGGALAPGIAYELWRTSEGTAIPVGLTDGGDWMSVQGTTTAGMTLAVTVEPAQGSVQPTGTPIASVQTS